MSIEIVDKIPATSNGRSLYREFMSKKLRDLRADYEAKGEEIQQKTLFKLATTAWSQEHPKTGKAPSRAATGAGGAKPKKQIGPSSS